MIPIYSSYYAKVKSLDISDALLVQVSQTKPDWFPYEILNVANLAAPSWLIISQYKNGEIDFERFGEQYRQSLDTKMRKEEFVGMLQRKAEEINARMIILLCWEKDSLTCHRHHLGNWLGDDFLYEL